MFLQQSQKPTSKRRHSCLDDNPPACIQGAIAMLGHGGKIDCSKRTKVVEAVLGLAGHGTLSIRVSFHR